jgi:transposase
MNTSRSTIHNRINNLHYNLGDRKRFKFDEMFFQTLNNTSCYWAGFIGADGNIHKNSLAIEIHKKDINHLEKFRKCIKHESPIKHRLSRNSCVVRVVSKTFIEDLNKNFNIVPCKSLVLKPPSLEVENHIRSYIRGYIDGDGSYSSKYSILSIRGTKEVLLWIKWAFNKFADIKTKTQVLFDTGTYKLQIQGKNKYKSAIEWLFKCVTNTTILDRKYEIVKEIVNLTNPDIELFTIKDYRIVKDDVIKDRKNGLSKLKISKKHNVSTSYVTGILKANNIDYYDRKRLSLSEVEEIRGMINNQISYVNIANKFGVNKSTIYDVAKNYSWKNTKGENK